MKLPLFACALSFSLLFLPSMAMENIIEKTPSENEEHVTLTVPKKQENLVENVLEEKQGEEKLSLLKKSKRDDSKLFIKTMGLVFNYYGTNNIDDKTLDEFFKNAKADDSEQGPITLGFAPHHLNKVFDTFFKIKLDNKNLTELDSTKKDNLAKDIARDIYNSRKIRTQLAYYEAQRLLSDRQESALLDGSTNLGPLCSYTFWTCISMLCILPDCCAFHCSNE
jgi:hypothetical protein